MIAKKSLLVILNTFFGAFLGLLAWKFLALYLGQNTIGEVETAFGFLGILFFVTDLGFGRAYMKRVSEGMDEGDCFATFVAFKLASTGIFVAIVVGALWFRTQVQGRVIEDTSALIILIVMGYLVTNSLRLTIIHTFDARRETARSQLTLLVDTGVRVTSALLLAVLYAALALDAGPLHEMVSEPTNALLAFIADNPAASLAGTYLVAGSAALLVTLHQARGKLQFGRFRMAILRSYWAFALPVFLASAVSGISSYVDRAALGYFGGAADAGAFGPLRRITMVLENIPSALGLLLFPTFSALSANRDTDAIENTMRQAVRYSAMVIFPPVVALAIFSPHVIHLALSNEWLPSWTTLSVLAFYALLLTIMRPYTVLAQGLNRPDIAARAGIAMSLSNIVLNLLLIPDDIQSLGIPLAGLSDLGAAIATVLSGIIGFLMIQVSTKRLVGFSASGNILRQAAAAIGMAAVLIVIDIYLIPGFAAWYELLFYCAVGGLVYLGLLVVLREFDREDWHFFWRTANPRGLVGYVRDELFTRK